MYIIRAPVALKWNISTMTEKVYKIVQKYFNDDLYLTYTIKMYIALVGILRRPLKLKRAVQTITTSLFMHIL